MLSTPIHRLPKVFRFLAEHPDRAVDDALVGSLSDLEPGPQRAAVAVLLHRRRQHAVRSLIARFDRLPPFVQGLLLDQADALFTGARLAVDDEVFEVRRSALCFIRRARNGRLAYLLLDALRHTCPKTRSLAAEALRTVTGDLLERLAAADGRPIPPGILEERRLLSETLYEALSCWSLHLRLEALEPAMWMAPQLERAIADKVTELRSNIDRAMTGVLRSSLDPRLAPFALQALVIPELRGPVAATIASCRSGDFMAALAQAAWVLADPRVCRSCAWIRRLAWLEDGIEPLLSLDPPAAAGAVRVIRACGLPHDDKIVLLRAALLCGNVKLVRPALWVLLDDESDAATTVLHFFAGGTDGPLVEVALRELRRRRPDDVEASAADDPRFARFWVGFEAMEAERRVELGRRLLESLPAFDRLLQAKLNAADVGERTKAIRVVRTLDLSKRMAEEVYRLCHDSNSVVRSNAVAGLVALGGELAIRILEDAMDDPDHRVQANAIEALGFFAAQITSRRLARLCEKLASGNARVRTNAIRVLMSQGHRPAAETLVDMLDHGGSGHRLSAMWLVERLRLHTLRNRAERLARIDPDERVRRRAARAVRILRSDSPPASTAAMAGGQPRNA